jgi:hypothetical protein
MCRPAEAPEPEVSKITLCPQRRLQYIPKHQHNIPAAISPGTGDHFNNKPALLRANKYFHRKKTIE